MSLGLGVDVAEIKRFAIFNKNRDSRFLSDNYNRNELKYCFSFKDSASHLAGTFAAKEAVFKALAGSRGIGSDKKILFSKIEIRRDKNGRPNVYIKNKRQSSIVISISHAAGVAVAIAMRQ